MQLVRAVVNARIDDLGVIPPEVQPVGDVVERALQRHLGDVRPVGVVVAVVRADPAQHLHPDDAAVVVAALLEQHAPEPLGRPG